MTLGGPVKSVPQPRPTAPRVVGPNPWVPSDQTVPIYTQDHPPATPKLEELPLKESVSQYGITWTFDKPARVDQFINGDCYVVGPVTIKAITLLKAQSRLLNDISHELRSPLARLNVALGLARQRASVSPRRPDVSGFCGAAPPPDVRVGHVSVSARPGHQEHHRHPAGGPAGRPVVEERSGVMAAAGGCTDS